MPGRALFVSYYFPPLGGIGSLRAVRFATYLPASGWDVRVVAPRHGAYHRDPSLRFPEHRVVRSPSIELSRLGKRAVRAGGDDTTPAPVSGVRARLQSFARSRLYWPDAQRGWIPGARWAARNERFDVVYSSSFPISAHVAARAIAARAGVPWVAEFRDPWVGDDRTARFERALLADATAVVTMSDTWAGVYRARGARAVTVIPNAVDSPAFVAAGDRFVLTHLGTLYAGRQHLDTVWRAIASAPDSVDEIRFVGSLPDATRAELRGLGLESRVTTTGFLPRADVPDALQGSTAFLAAAYKDDGWVARGTIPAKLLEYLGTDRPIVYVGHTADDAAQLLAPYPDCHRVEPGDLAAALAALDASRRPVGGRDPSALSVERLTARLAEVFDAVSPEPGLSTVSEV